MRCNAIDDSYGPKHSVWYTYCVKIQETVAQPTDTRTKSMYLVRYTLRTM
jgi:hypothetical protein